MTSKARVVTWASIAGAATLIVALALVIMPAQSVDINSLGPEEYKELESSRNQIATSVALDDSRVKEELEGSIKNVMDFNLSEDHDSVTIRTWGAMDVSGVWVEGYDIVYGQGKIIDVPVDRRTNSVISVDVTQRTEEVVEKDFTDEELHLVEIFMQDSRVIDELLDMEDGKDYYVGEVRSEGLGSKSLILVFSPQNDGLILEGGVDQDTDEVTYVKPHPA